MGPLQCVGDGSGDMRVRCSVLEMVVEIFGSVAVCWRW